MKAKQIINENYEYHAFCPYRICPLGAHIDHQFGVVTGFAIDHGISLDYDITNDGSVNVISNNVAGETSFNISDELIRRNDWGDFLRGVVYELKKKHTLNRGLTGALTGSLPIGGLSSSAALSLVFMSAICRANGIQPTDMEKILTAKAAENNFVGVNCGKLDQSTEVYSRKDSLLFLDTLDDSYELIPQPKTMKPYKIAVIFSGVEHRLAESGYNARQDECKAAAYSLMAYAKMQPSMFADARLRYVPREIFESFKDRLPETFKKRATHYYSEFDRTVAGAEAFRRGDIEEFGRLCFESGASSIDNYEAGSPELKTIFDIMRETDGIYGGRFSGAGFSGCLIAFVDPSFAESAKNAIRRKYLARYPLLSDKFNIYYTSTADGCSL